MLAIIDYGSGNLRSVAKALARVAPSKAVRTTTRPDDLRVASHIVLPGVGAFADCMAGLSAISGMLETLREEVLGRKKMFLGICVGMQMLFEKGLEHGSHAGLGWLKGDVVPLSPSDNTYKIPHMGWNELQAINDHPLLKGLENGDHAYFVHSYHAQCTSEDNVLATTPYGQTIAAVVGQGNIMGTQFHPEKSQTAGLRLLQNFVSM